MARELPGGYELDDDRDRIDVDLVHRYLSEEAYWALGRSRQTIERLVRESTRVIGAYLGDEQVGFTRVMSDGTAMAWLGDVFVLPTHRGRARGGARPGGRRASVASRAHVVPEHARRARALRGVRLRGAERADDGPAPPEPARLTSDRG
jgi:hypothetical protein